MSWTGLFFKVLDDPKSPTKPVPPIVEPSALQVWSAFVAWGAFAVWAGRGIAAVATADNAQPVECTSGPLICSMVAWCAYSLERLRAERKPQRPPT